MKPSDQFPFTFGATPAGMRLYSEVGKSGARYRSAVSKLHKAEEKLNDIVSSNLLHKHFFILRLRDHTMDAISQTQSDEIIRSLCRNVFAAKARQRIKELK